MLLHLALLKVYQCGDVEAKAAACSPVLAVSRHVLASVAEIPGWGRGGGGRLAQIGHNSWHPGFDAKAQHARLEPPPGGI